MTNILLIITNNTGNIYPRNSAMNASELQEHLEGTVPPNSLNLDICSLFKATL